MQFPCQIQRDTLWDVSCRRIIFRWIPVFAGISMSRNYDRRRNQYKAHSCPAKWATKWLPSVGAFPQERVLILQSGRDIYYQFTTSRAVKHDPWHIYICTHVSLGIRMHRKGCCCQFEAHPDPFSKYNSFQITSWIKLQLQLEKY